jgi:hypothetical protein
MESYDWSTNGEAAFDPPQPSQLKSNGVQNLCQFIVASREEREKSINLIPLNIVTHDIYA